MRQATSKLAEKAQSTVVALDQSLQGIEKKVGEKAVDLKTKASAMRNKGVDPFTKADSESDILRDPSTTVYDKILSIIGEIDDEDSEDEDQKNKG